MATENLDEKLIFNTAREITSPEARANYLRQACASDSHLRERVETLLKAYQEQVSFLESPPVIALTPTAAQPQPILPGAIIGPYKLLQEIGEGGMGTVFMAEQSQPVKRRVALKVIKPGMDSRQVIARFEAERQALSMMDHPNIAKVLDAGTTDGGRPYFVMELVKGQPITHYCDEHLLTPRQRLELILPVCHAIQHAHQKGIIHRDIKPSNILVAEYDSQPVPKVIDFGVAKAINQPLTDKTMFTGLGHVVGTLEYMSPEQAKVNQLDIDTRSDIYSLGVLLYELLTGTTPFDKKRLRNAALDEMLRIIREEDPPKPSTRLTDSIESLPSISAQRHTEPTKLAKMVRGELDWIVMKALEKDRNRRYETANGFAMDLQRYLSDELVQAGPPTASYRIRKFLKRNMGPVIAVSIILLSLMAGIIGTTVSLVWAVRERNEKAAAWLAETKAREAETQAADKAIAALRAMTDDFVESQMARDTQVTEENKDFLRKIIAHFEGFAAVTTDDVKSRAIRAEGYARVGVMRYRLGEPKEAETAYADALALLKQLTADFPDLLQFRRELALSHNNLGVLYYETGRLQAADEAYAEAIALRKQLAADFPDLPDIRLELAQSHYNVGSLLYSTGRLQEAEAAHIEALALRKQLVADFPNRLEFRLELANSYHNHSSRLRNTGRMQEAGIACAEALNLRKQLAADFPTRPEFRQNLAQSYKDLGIQLKDTGKLKEAETAYSEALALQKQLAAEFPAQPDYRRGLALSLNSLAILLYQTSQLKDAETAYVDAIALQKQLSANFPRRPEFREELAMSHNNLANLLNDTGRLKEAEAVFVDAVALFRQLASEFPTRPQFRRYLAQSHNNLGSLLRDTGRMREAEAAHRSSLALQKQLVADFPSQHEYRLELALCHNNLGSLLRDTGRMKEAEAAIGETLALRKQLVAEFPAHPEFRQAMGGSYNNLGDVFNQMGRFKEAEAAFVEALAIRKQLVTEIPTRPDLRHDLGRTRHDLGYVFLAMNRFEQAEAAFIDALMLQKQLVTEFPTSLVFRIELAKKYNSLGTLYSLRNRLQQAESAFAESLALWKRLTVDSPNQADLRNDLAGTCVNLANLRHRIRDFPGAKVFLEEAGPYHAAALEANPRNPDYRQFYRNNLRTLMRTHAGLGDNTSAVQVAKKLCNIGWNPPENAFDAARGLALCVVIVRSDNKANSEDRDKQVQFYGDEAMKMLRDAVAKGFNNASFMKNDVELSSIRTREDFRKLVGELEGKRKP